MESMRSLFAIAIASLAVVISPASAADWVTAPSYYTHDWSSGERVAQYSPVGPFYYHHRADYVKSGYQHYRSTIDLGNSSDNLHIVEEWGRPVRPYEEWRFPFRPYSVPYDAWGPPFGGLGNGVGVLPFGGFPAAGNGAGPYPYSGQGPYPYSGAEPAGAPPYGPIAPGGGFHGPSQQPPANFAQPWLDGHYPRYDTRDRSDYWRPYTAPRRP
jgi:hypothetical protein